MPTFDLHIAKYDEFYHFPVLLNLQLFHVPGMLEPRNWAENRAMYTPFSIRAFGSFTDTIPCRVNADFRATFSGIDKIDFTTSYIITADDTFEVATFSCSRYARTPKLGRKPRYVYPIKYLIIRKFHGYRAELSKCRLSTYILRKMTNFIISPYF